VTGDPAPFSEPLRNIPFGDSLPSNEFDSKALLIRGSKSGPSRVRLVLQIARVRDCMGMPYKLPSNAEFEASHAVFKGA
jgi:hypothetical protein